MNVSLGCARSATECGCGVECEGVGVAEVDGCEEDVDEDAVEDEEAK